MTMTIDKFNKARARLNEAAADLHFMRESALEADEKMLTATEATMKIRNFDVKNSHVCVAIARRLVVRLTKAVLEAAELIDEDKFENRAKNYHVDYDVLECDIADFEDEIALHKKEVTQQIADNAAARVDLSVIEKRTGKKFVVNEDNSALVEVSD